MPGGSTLGIRSLTSFVVSPRPALPSLDWPAPALAWSAWRSTSGSRPAPAPDAPPPLERPAPGLHTYTGIVEKVVDGDTLDVRIDLGFDVWRVERLRLRGIDAPEMNTPAGRAAREFVERALADCELVAFRTYKTDIYARYIADVFYDPAARERTAIVTQGRFLNQELLDAGQAVRAYW